MVEARRAGLVTGANRGIGLEIARQLVARGLRVVGTSRDLAAGQRALGEVGAECVALDVADPAQCVALGDRFDGALDVLVNNAGIALDGFDARVARQTVDVNFRGPLVLTDALLPRLRTGARVVMVSSGVGELSCLAPALRARFEAPALDRAALSGLVEEFVDDVAAGVHAERGWPTSAYAVSKVALNALTRIFARELAGDPRDIVVNAMCPGWVRSRMGGRAAPRSVEEGAHTAVWLAMRPAGAASGRFYRDEKEIPF